MAGKCDDKRDLKQLGRLKGNAAGKQQPCFIIGAGGGVADEKSQSDKRKSGACNNEFMPRDRLVVDERRHKHHGDKAEKKCAELNIKLLHTAGVMRSGHDRDTSE